MRLLLLLLLLLPSFLSFFCLPIIAIWITGQDVREEDEDQD